MFCLTHRDLLQANSSLMKFYSYSQQPQPCANMTFMSKFNAHKMSSYPHQHSNFQLYNVLRDYDKCGRNCLVAFAKITKLESLDEITGCGGHSDFMRCQFTLIKQSWRGGFCRKTFVGTAVHPQFSYPSHDPHSYFGAENHDLHFQSSLKG